MALRFQLYSEQLGPLIIERGDPIDINALKQTIKRSKDINDGVLYEVILDVEFIKEGRSYLKTAYEQCGGIDAKVDVVIYDRNPNTRKWELYSVGQINFQRYEVTETSITVNIEQTGFQTKVLNLKEVDINLETTVSENGIALPTSDAIEIPFHSKTILRTYLRNMLGVGGLDSELDNFNLPSGDTYLIPDFNEVRQTSVLPVTNDDNGEVNDFEDALFEYPTGISDISPIISYRYFIKALEQGDYTIIITSLKYEFKGQPGLNKDLSAQWFIDIKKEDGTITSTAISSLLTSVDGTDINDELNYTNTFTLDVNDSFFLYLKFTNAGTQNIYFQAIASQVFSTDHFEFNGTPFLKLTALTTYPSTTSKVIFLHDAIKRCVQYITGQEDCFYSELLGRTELGYSDDGDGALIVVTNGNNIRKQIVDGATKNIISNLKDLIDLANSLFCVGFGFETQANGTKKLRLEKIDFFYDKNTKVISLGKVYNPKLKLDSKRFYNQIEFGYSGKIDIDQINAIDEFNSLRKYKIPVNNTKGQLKIASSFKAGGYQVEYQRRLSTPVKKDAKTKPGKYDDDLFVICVVRDGMGSFKTQSNEGFDSFDKLINPETGYNYNISPARSLRNWSKVIAASLTKSTSAKILKFSGGEVNYQAGIKKSSDYALIYENGDVDLTNIEPIWESEIYSLSDVPMSRDLWKQIKANPFGYIEFEDQFGNIMQGFISDGGIEHDSNKGTANLDLLKVFRKQV